MPRTTQSDIEERGADDGCSINFDYPWLARIIMRQPALLSIAMRLAHDSHRNESGPLPTATAQEPGSPER